MIFATHDQDQLPCFIKDRSRVCSLTREKIQGSYLETAQVSEDVDET